MIDLKLAKSMTGGIIRQKCARIHVMTTTRNMIQEVFGGIPWVNNPTDRQCRLLAYGAMGAIIEHTRMRATYYRVMACASPSAAKRAAKNYSLAR